MTIFTWTWKFRILSQNTKTNFPIPLSFLILFVLVFLGSNLSCSSAADSSKPRLFVWLHFESNRTQKIELSDANKPFNFSSSENASRLQIQCLASYPVEWRLSSQFAQQLSDYGISAYRIPLSGSKLLNRNQTNRLASIFDPDGKGAVYSLEIVVELEKDFVGDIGACQERIEKNGHKKKTDQKQKLSITSTESGGSSTDRGLEITTVTNNDVGVEDGGKKMAKIVVQENSEVHCINNDDAVGVSKEKGSNQFLALICWTRFECDFLRGCSSPNCTENAMKKKVQSCGEGVKEDSCRALPGNFSTRLPRLLTCTFNGIENEVHAYSFIGLDGKQYFINTDSDSVKIPPPPESALIQIGKKVNKTKEITEIIPLNQSTLFTNETHVFEVNASRFFFTEELRVVVHYENGTEVEFPEEFIKVKSNPRPSLYHIGVEVTFNLTTDMKRVVARVPWYNSSKLIQTDQQIDVKDPRIIFDKGDKEIAAFNLGDSRGFLECKADAVPPPTLRWLNQSRMEILNKVSGFSVTYTPTAASSFSRLDFPELQQHHEGVYICEAKSGAQTSNKTFKVEINDPSLGIGSIIGISIGAVIFVLAFLFILYEYVKTKRKLRNLTADEIDEFEKGNPAMLKNAEVQGENAHLLPFNKQYEIPNSEFTIDQDKVLGSGEFGVVCRGKLRGVDVAVKTTKSTADVEFFKGFLKEIKVMTFLGKHPNVVELLGTSTTRIRERVVFVLVEIAKHGCLSSFLMKNGANFVNILSSSQIFNVFPEQLLSMGYANIDATVQITTLDLVRWCRQIAAGMAHLSLKKIVHGDLAPRNVLLFEDYSAKITDFGLSRQLYSDIYSKKGKSPLPWRIMAPESLKHLQFSTKSDVWAFGVLVWETFSLGTVPYAGMSWTNEFVDNLDAGLRLQKPKWATNEIYENMCACWNPQPQSRPSFEQLEKFFNEILGSCNESEGIYMQV